MNIFVLDLDPKQAAIYHGDKHVVKMILETAQMLSTAHRLADNCKFGFYQITHKSHPCSKWVRSSSSNYHWALKLLASLCEEFEYRRGKKHKTEGLLYMLRDSPSFYPSESPLPRPQCMPDEFKCDNVVDAYRSYYQSKCDEGIVTYKWGRNPPNWLNVPTSH